MSKSNTFEQSFLQMIFNNVPLADLSTGAGSIQVSLHTADPGEAGTQAANETAYGGYARVAVARSTAGWVVSSGVASPVSNIDFGECTTTPGGAITHFGIGSTSQLLYSGTVTPNITMAIGVIPRLKPTSTITED